MKRNIIVFTILTLIMFAIGMLARIIYNNFYPNHSRFVEPYTGPEMAKLKKLMQKHGVSSAECEGSDCYFMRDGKRCALK